MVSLDDDLIDLHSTSSTKATARHHPPLPLRIFTGKSATEKPSCGRRRRFVRYSTRQNSRSRPRW